MFLHSYSSIKLTLSERVAKGSISNVFILVWIFRTWWCPCRNENQGTLTSCLQFVFEIDPLLYFLYLLKKRVSWDQALRSCFSFHTSTLFLCTGIPSSNIAKFFIFCSFRCSLPLTRSLLSVSNIETSYKRLSPLE